MPERQGDHHERDAEHGEFRWVVVAQGFGGEDQAGYQGDAERDAAVEAAGLGVGPGIHGARDLATVFRVGAFALGGAVVADLGSCSVADEAQLVVGLGAREDLIFRTDPGVVRGMVRKPSVTVAHRTRVRVAGQQVEADGEAQEERGVSGGEEDLHVQAYRLPGSATSVNSTSSGSSIVTCGTVWRTPR